MDHETGESLEGTWYADAGAHLDEDSFSGVDVDLKLAGLVDRRIKEGQKTLVCNIWSRIANVAIHLAHDADMFVTVQQRVFLLPLRTRSVSAIASLVCLEASI